MNLITEPYFSSKKKFFYKNLLDENSKIDFLAHHRMIEKMKENKEVINYTQRSQYKPLYPMGSPKHSLEQITTKQSTHLATTQRVIANINTIASFEQDPIPKRRRTNLKKIRMITQVTEELPILDYLENVKQTQQQKQQMKGVLDRLDEKQDTFVSLNQLKQNHFKSIKAEQYLYLHKLSFSSFAVHSVKVLKSITVQEIIDLYLSVQKKQTSQFSCVDQIVQSFLSDLEIASKIYNSTKLMASALCKITGIDYKLFFLLYKPKRILPSNNTFVIDENFANNYQYVHIDCYDIYYRIFGGGELPYDYQEHMKDFFNSDSVPTIYSSQIRPKDFKSMKQKLENDFGHDKTGWYNNASKIDVDLDFIRKLLYYQKNLQINLKNKQADIIINKQLQLQKYSKTIVTEQQAEEQKQLIPQASSILFKIETAENQIGSFPLVSRANSVVNDSEREEFDDGEGDTLCFFQNIDQVYQEIPGVTTNYGSFAQSQIISSSLAFYIVKQSLKAAEAKFIETQIPINANNQALAIMELIVACKINGHGLSIDGCEMAEDVEPIVIDYDRWRRNRVSMAEIQTGSEEEENVEEALPSQHQSNNKQRFSVLERKKTALVAPPQSSQSEIRLIEFQVAEEEDEFVDKLRSKKLYDIKKKNEIEQKIKEDQIQNQKKDNSSSKYTFDYDGKILLNRGVKMDKLQPTNLKIKVDLKELPKQSSQLANSKKGSMQNIAIQAPPPIPPKAIADIPNKNLIDRKDVAKDALGDKALRQDRGAQFPYETFAMNNGVKLIFEQRQKEGVRHQVSDSAEQLQYRLSGQNFLPGDDVSKQIQQIRLTRTEYKLLTDNGSVFQQQTKSQQFLPQEEVKKSDQKTEKTVQFNESHVQNAKFSPEKRGEYKEIKKEKISMRNAKLLESLLLGPAKPETPSKPYKPSSGNALPKNPIDTFNQSLLNSKDWGKANAKVGYFPPVRVAQYRSHNGSLEQLYKLPRDRVNVQQFRTSSESFKLTTSKKADGMFQTFYTTHSKFDEKLRQF